MDFFELCTRVTTKTGARCFFYSQKCQFHMIGHQFCEELVSSEKKIAVMAVQNTRNMQSENMDREDEKKE